jgi:hypothetical protein
VVYSSRLSGLGENSSNKATDRPRKFYWTQMSTDKNRNRLPPARGFFNSP